MAESKIITRYEMYEMFYDAIPEEFIADGAPCEFTTFVDCMYGDNVYNAERCASKLETSYTMNDFMYDFLDGYVDHYCCAAPPTMYTPSLASNQLVPVDKFIDPTTKFSGGKFDSIYTPTPNFSITQNAGIAVSFDLFLEMSGEKTFIMGGNIPLSNTGSQQATYSKSFITDNNGYIGMKLYFSNITSHNISEVQLKTSSLTLTLSKRDTTTNTATFTRYLSKQNMDTLLNEYLYIKINGTLVGAQEPDVIYQFNLKNIPYVAETNINLNTSLYTKGTSEVSLAYSRHSLAENKVVLYSSSLEQLYSTTAASLNNFKITMPSGFHYIVKDFCNQGYQYFFLKVPLEYINSYGGGWERVVLYYPLMVDMITSEQYLQIRTGPLYLGVSNYHNTSGWRLIIENTSTQGGLARIYLPDHGTSATNMSIGTDSGSGADITVYESGNAIPHILYFYSSSGTRTLTISAEGTQYYADFGTSKTKINLIPNATSTDFDMIVHALNQNESESIGYTISNKLNH